MSGVSCEEHWETGDMNRFLSSFSLCLACSFCVVATWNQSSLLGPTAEIATTVVFLNQGSNNRGIFRAVYPYCCGTFFVWESRGELSTFFAWASSNYNINTHINFVRCWKFYINVHNFLILSWHFPRHALFSRNLLLAMLIYYLPGVFSWTLKNISSLFS